MDILIIDDDADINQLIYMSLTNKGYYCQQAFSGTEALMLIEKENYKLIILDLMLPGLMGEDLVKEIRNISVVPIIVVSAKDKLESKLDLLSLGADDYLVKPFEIEELVMRVDVQFRRLNQQPIKNIIKYKDLVLDKSTYQITIKDKIVNFTRQEYLILELLLSYPSKVFTKQEIYEYAWEDDLYIEDKTINVHISHIRKKIQAVSNQDYIETIWGFGFKLA